MFTHSHYMNSFNALTYREIWTSYIKHEFQTDDVYHSILTVGCSAITANANARIMVMTMKKTLRPQSLPEGLNQMNRMPENANAAM